MTIEALIVFFFLFYFSLALQVWMRFCGSRLGKLTGSILGPWRRVEDRGGRFGASPERFSIYKWMAFDIDVEVYQ